jgi:hypothetical protein
MANAKYPTAKKKILDADIDFLVDDIKAVAVTSAYTYNSAHEFRSSLTGELGITAALSGKTTTSGVFNASDLEPALTSVSGNIDAWVLIKDTGVSATSPLIAYIDTGTGLPHTGDGGNVDLVWNPSGILAI